VIFPPGGKVWWNWQRFDFGLPAFRKAGVTVKLKKCLTKVEEFGSIIALRKINLN
jgi:hypothetical protein